MGNEEKIRYLNTLVVHLVHGVNELQEKLAGLDIEGGKADPGQILDQLDELLKVESPSGETGTLIAHEDDRWSIVFGARITGLRIMSTKPGDFNGVVWSEEMDRAPREDIEE